MKEALRRWASQTLMWCCWVSSDTRSTLHGCCRARSFEKKAMSRMAGLLVDGEGRRDSSGSQIFSGGNREEGRGRGGLGGGNWGPWSRSPRRGVGEEPGTHVFSEDGPHRHAQV